MLRIILKKEFRQIFRNPSILRMMLMMPILQLILIPLAADFEVKHINLGIVDLDHSTYSQRLVQKMTASGYFRLVDYAPNYATALAKVQRNEADLVLTIPANFERDLVRENRARTHLAIDAINGAKAGLGGVYANAIIADFNREIREKWIQTPRSSELPQIELLTLNWYNPHVKYPLFMVPGILALLVTMVGTLMTALNIVHEKEIGTIEQLNVTPIKKYQFILGKLIPFLVIGLVSLSIGLVVGRLIYGVVVHGSYATLYLFSVVYLVGVLGIGLLLSTFVDTQQQVMLLAFFIMMLFVMMGGLYTPLDTMPVWARHIADATPVSHFINVMRSIILKGSTLYDLRQEFYTLCGFAVLFNTLAIWNYRKRS